MMKMIMKHFFSFSESCGQGLLHRCQAQEVPDSGELDQEPAEHALVLLLRVQGQSSSSPGDDPQHPQAHQWGARVPGEQIVQKVLAWRAGG